MRHKIDGEVPKGAPLRKVQKWTVGNLGGSFYEPASEFFSDYDAGFNHHSRKDTDGVLLAMINNTEQGFVYIKSIRVFFFFDKNKKLMDYAVFETATTL